MLWIYLIQPVILYEGLFYLAWEQQQYLLALWVVSRECHWFLVQERLEIQIRAGNNNDQAPDINQQCTCPAIQAKSRRETRVKFTLQTPFWHSKQIFHILALKQPNGFLYDQSVFKEIWNTRCLRPNSGLQNLAPRTPFPRAPWLCKRENRC